MLDPTDVWNVRLEITDRPGKGRVVDAATGEEVGARFPSKIAHRLRRSLESGRPIRVRLFLLDPADGRPYLDGPDHIASEARWVRVVGKV